MATLDVLTLDEARTAINAGSRQDWDDDLTRLTTAVSLRMDELAGPIVTRTTTEYHDGGCMTIRPFARPISSITSVTEYQDTTAVTLTAESVSTHPANAYSWDPTRGIITRRSAGVDWQFYPGRRNIVLICNAGRAASTSAVDARFKAAAAIILAHVWRTERGTGNQTFGAGGTDNQFGQFSSFSIPRRAMELLGDQRRVPGVA